jgi:hypothetical protein
MCVVYDACDDGQEGGASGRDIINALVDNSSSFANKTAFAQQKYLKKKALQCVFVFDCTWSCAYVAYINGMFVYMKGGVRAVVQVCAYTCRLCAYACTHMHR